MFSSHNRNVSVAEKKSIYFNNTYKSKYGDFQELDGFRVTFQSSRTFIIFVIFVSLVVIIALVEGVEGGRTPAWSGSFSP